MNIRFVPREEIDKVKFNSCIHYAINGNIFGYIWFLDYVAKDWDALVEGEYESVFPLVWRKNALGQKELYQPELMRELGIFSINVLSPKRITAFLEAIPTEYQHIDIYLNEQNRIPEGKPFDIEERTNHQMLLTDNYEQLRNNYHADLKKALEKAEDGDLLPTTSIKPEQIAALYKENTPKNKNLDRNFHALQRIMYNALHRGWGFASGIQTRTGTLLAANFYLYSHKKVISLVPIQSPAGKEQGALIFLFDMLLRTHAGKPMILDFNTQGNENLAVQLGADPTYYYRFLSGKKAWWQVW